MYIIGIEFFIFQEVDNPKHSVMIMMTLYANVALKGFSQSDTDQVTSTYNKDNR